eukprot:1560070-Rhodomonas_salina.1
MPIALRAPYAVSGTDLQVPPIALAPPTPCPVLTCRPQFYRSGLYSGGSPRYLPLSFARIRRLLPLSPSLP